MPRKGGGGGMRQPRRPMSTTPSRPTAPTAVPKKGGNAVQPRQPGALGTFAGTAAGVAAGTVIGDKITGRSESSSAPVDGALPVGPCLYEEQQLLGCAQTEADLQVCESFRQAWLNCKQKYNL